MLRKVAIIGISLAVALATAGCGSSENSDEEASSGTGAINVKTIIEARKRHFKSISKSNKIIQAEIKKDKPSVVAIQENAAVIAALSKDLPSWFPSGTGPESKIETEASALVWKKSAEFKKFSDDFIAHSSDLRNASASGNMTSIVKAAEATASDCKACHKVFREKK